eukprot:SAG11_NODE_31421_length_292_cov_0.616580_1_plen_31_part_01
MVELQQELQFANAIITAPAPEPAPECIIVLH